MQMERPFWIACFVALPLIQSELVLADDPIPVLHSDALSNRSSETKTRNTALLQAANEVEDGAVCTTIDFEGVGDLSLIPEFDGITSPGWLGIIDADAGGSGNFAFEPSPETIAFWLGGPAGSREILVRDAASKVGFLYASYVTVRLEAFDADGNLLDSATGPANWNSGPGGDPTGTFNQWDLLEVESQENEIARVRVSGNVNQTGIDDLKICRRSRIARIEITQAIQEIQEIDDLIADLGSDREPPVPLIAEKPAVMRVYLGQVQNVVSVRVQAEIPGVLNQTRSLRLQPHCDPDLRRRLERGCRSLDFYFQPPEGNWTATVRLMTDEEEELETHELPLRSRVADRLVLRSVSVCDSRDPATGAWQCGGAGQLGGLIDFLSRTAPTSRVEVSATNNFVRNDITTYDANGDGVIDRNEAADWFVDTVAQVGNLYSLWDWIVGLFGEERYYYGMIRNAVPGGIGGIADGIPSRGAMSRESTVRLGVEANDETVAHETGHMFGRRHTNTDVPRAGASPPGCYNLARDGGTDWPFADNTLRSNNGQEVGFDVAARSVVLPEDNFDWMSYCTPRWISPFTYNRAMPPLGAGPVATTATTEGQEGTLGLFWTVSGRINGEMAVLDPIFQLELVGPIDEGSGEYLIEVRDTTGTALFARWFTPRVAETESEDGHIEGPPVFFELVPTQAGVAHIAVLDSTGAELAVVGFGGAAPEVTISSPAPGDTLSGIETVSWAITDVDSTEHSSAVDYSVDNGESWSRLGMVANQSSLVVDFAEVPGAANALLRVLVSDGVNTGIAISGPFTVARKLPAVVIIGPADDEVFGLLDLVWLRANAYDQDDGFLDGNAVAWWSSIDGLLGVGSNLALTTLSGGLHTLSVEATDSDGNYVSSSVSIRVAEAPPELDLTVTKLDELPTTCVQVAIDARTGSAVIDLAGLEYSLDGGATWNAVGLGDLPFQFIVPGQGFFHLVGRVFDEVGQLDAKDHRFFVDTPCRNLLTITCPSDISVTTAAGPSNCDEVVSYSVTASDGCDASPTITCTAPSNSSVTPTEGTFPVGTTTVTCVATDSCSNTSSCSFDIEVNDPPQITSVSAYSQVVQYSDKIIPVTITATDCGPGPLTISTAGVPTSLSLPAAATSCTNTSSGVECTFTLSGQVLVPEADYDITVSVLDEEDLASATSTTTIQVKAEDATIAFDGGNPVAVQVATDGGNSGVFSLSADVRELVPDLARVGNALPGDIREAVLAMTLAPVGPGGSAVGTCTPDNAGSLSGFDYAEVVIFTCTFHDVPVNTYAVDAVLVADNADELYYTGSNEDVVVVFDPSLGFTTGGGHFAWPGTGDRTNFGYTMKYNKKRTNIRGSLLLIRHVPDGSVYRLKSNALYGLAIGDEPGYGWASFAGKGTYKDPSMVDPVGNYEFVGYVEDHGEPGAGLDRCWLQVFDRERLLVGDLSMDETADSNAETMIGGNIVVPHVTGGAR